MIETLKAGLLLKTDKGMNTDKSHEIWTGVTGPVLILGSSSLTVNSIASRLGMIFTERE